MKKHTFLIASVVIGMLHIFLVLYYGSLKEGFHEDEYYSYFTSSGKADLSTRL